MSFWKNVFLIICVVMMHGCGWETVHIFRSDIDPTDPAIPDWTVVVSILRLPKSSSAGNWRCDARVEAVASKTNPATILTTDSLHILETDKPRSPEMTWQSEFPYRHSSNNKASGTAAMVDIPPNAQWIRCKVFYSIEDLGDGSVETVGVEYKLTYRKEKEFWLGY